MGLAFCKKNTGIVSHLETPPWFKALIPVINKAALQYTMSLSAKLERVWRQRQWFKLDFWMKWMQVRSGIHNGSPQPEFHSGKTADDGYSAE